MSMGLGAMMGPVLLFFRLIAFLIHPDVRAAAPAVTALLAAAQLFVAVCYGILAIQFRTIAAGLSSSQTGGGLSVCLGLGGVVLLQAAAVAGQLWLIRRCRRDRSEREVRALRELAQAGGAD